MFSPGALKVSMRFIIFLALAVTIFLIPSLLQAQTVSVPDEGEYIKSMSFARKWKPWAGVMFVSDKEPASTRYGFELNLGIYRDILNPVYGALALVGEGYGQVVEGETEGGLRLMAASRFFMVQAGADYSFRDEDADFILSFTVPIFRGGPLRRGGHFRLDWIPGRGHSLHFGLHIPFAQPFMGKTRAYKDYVRLPSYRTKKKPAVFEASAELAGAISNIREASDYIDRFTTPFLDEERTHGDDRDFIEKLEQAKKDILSTNENFPEGHTFTASINVYHRELERAFAIAARNQMEEYDLSRGAAVSRRARAILLDEVVLPYNRLLGERKKNDSVRGLGKKAGEIFRSYVEASSIPPANRQAVMFVFYSLIDAWEVNRKDARDRWDDSRLVWLPMHYVLKLEDHDTQGEIDAIIEKASQEKFTTGNDIHYVINEQFHPELGRMILETEDYHILWVHDFAGKNGLGDPDNVGYRITVRAYLRALIERARAYDETRKIPVYMIFVDQFWSQQSNSRMWLEFLEDPMNRTIKFPKEFAEWQEELNKARKDLAAAVAESKALQAGLEQYGEKWLKNRIKVHVSVTNPPDFSFRSANLFKYLWLVPDIVMIDHRKLCFRDVTELDPGRGEAIFTGTGVGEHFAGPTWEDRAILVRGPALVSLKDSARELLLTQGFKEDEIPPPLRAIPKPGNYGEMVEALVAKGWDATAMQVQNLTGYDMKHSNVVRGILYNLMPAGSHIYIADSLWNSFLWGGMVTGAALRGCWVFVITPSYENAPSDGIPQMSRANELFTRFVLIQNEMKDVIEEAGGMFKVGLYNLDIDVDDQIARGKAMEENFKKYEWLRDVFPYHQSVWDTLYTLDEYLVANGYKPVYLTGDAHARKPKLHLKSQFFASKEALSTLVPLEEWGPLVWNYVLARAQMVSSETYVDVKSIRYRISKDVEPLIDAFSAKLEPEEEERLIYYLTIGSHNEDYRGKVMDGEVVVVVSHFRAMVAYLDFTSILGLTEWIETVEELDKLLPPYGGFWYKFGRYVKLAV